MNSVVYKTSDDRFVFTIEYGDNKDLWKKVGEINELFDSYTVHPGCGGKTKIGVREIDGNSYYYKVCVKCGFQFSFGQHKKGGGLFPNNKKGWTKYDPTKEED